VASLSISTAESGRYSGQLKSNTPSAGGWRQLRVEQEPLAALIRPGQYLAIHAEEAVLKAHVSGIDHEQITLLLPPAEALKAKLPWFGELQLEGPLGQAWSTSQSETPAVVLAADLGIGPALALIDKLQPAPQLVMLEAGELELPFRPQPSLFIVNGLPAPVIAAVPALEAQGIPSRLADPQGSPGCYEGTLLELFQHWLAHKDEQPPLEVFASLSRPLLAELQSMPLLRIHALEI